MRRDPDQPLSRRLCRSYRTLAGADGAAITVHYESANRVTLCATNEVADQLEDLQEVLGEGPGHTASTSGQIERCEVPGDAPSRWPLFVEAAREIVESALVVAVPMHSDTSVLGVITLYQSPQSRTPLSLARHDLQFLADVVGTALVNDQDAAAPDLAGGPWASRARIHQATGMVVAQMKVSPEDALAVLRAHAFGQQSTLSDIASAVVERRITFSGR
ncbi:MULTISPECIES: GAF and ANTAR domain-containing protein [Mumia]|uniref:GAF and ANTAR domain-containing protein n=1 Tax=Mumia xiangluensis TaxID=1678900 RepID=A0ABW1QJY9_9ACTN|nr:MULTISPECIES: GAF and ANTAR domain-containing protein [Mumia]